VGFSLCTRENQRDWGPHQGMGCLHSASLTTMTSLRISYHQPESCIQQRGSPSLFWLGKAVSLVGNEAMWLLVEECKEKWRQENRMQSLQLYI
jgi:hypothetical protein